MGTKKENKNTKNNWILIGTVLIIILVAILPSVFPGYPTLDSICMGICASMVASLLYSLFSLYVLISPEHSETMDSLNTLNETMSLISNSGVIKNGLPCNEILVRANENAKEIAKVNSFLKLKDRGLRTIRSKRDVENEHEFWLGLIQDYNESLDIASRTISPWLTEAYRESFILGIEQRLVKGKTVRILILQPNAEETKQIEKRLGRRISRDINTTLQILKSSVWNKLSDEQKKIFAVKLCRTNIPYIYINNGLSVTVSPYMVSSTTQGKTFLAVFERTSQFIRGFDDDFTSLFNNAIDVDWGRVK